MTENCKMECEKCSIHACGPCHQLVKSETACCKCVPVPYCGNYTTAMPTGITMKRGSLTTGKKAKSFFDLFKYAGD